VKRRFTLFVFRNFAECSHSQEVSENKKKTQRSEFLFVARTPAAA